MGRAGLRLVGRRREGEAASAGRRAAGAARRGEAVYFPVGAEGAHGLRNETETPVRYLMASTLSSPEVVEYPDLRQITAQARTASTTGERLWLIHDVEARGDT